MCNYVIETLIIYWDQKKLRSIININKSILLLTTMHQSVSAVFQTCTRKIIKFEKNTERKGRKREKKTYTVFVAVGGEQIAVPYCWKNVRRVIHDIKRGDNKWKNKYKKNCTSSFQHLL